MNDLTTLTEADFIALEKAECEESFYWFVKQAWHVVEPARKLIENWHFDAICQHLEAVSRGEITRLAISLPPGHSKSLLVAVFFNAWVWTHSPYKRFLSSGSSEGFCERDNGKLRNLIKSEWYQKRWPMKFPSVDTVLRFENENTGFRWAKSYSSLTGGRANFLILDDVLPVDDGNSDIERAKVNRRFFEQATSRLESEDDAIIIIMQRVHEADLIGEIIERQNKGQNLGFDLLTIPMEYDGGSPPTSIGWTDPRTTHGELLCPAYRSQAWVDREKVTMDVYAWSSQFNQEPVPRGNGLFVREHFKLYDPGNRDDRPSELPDHLTYYLTSDHANGGQDYNVIRVWGVDENRHFWLVDSYRERGTINQGLGISIKDGRLSVADRGALAFVKRYPIRCWYAEPDPMFKTAFETVRETMRATGIHCRIEFSTRFNKNKADKTVAFQSLSQLGMIHLPDNAIGESAIVEYCAFPNAARDDQVDADSILPRMTAHAAFVAPVERSKRDNDYIGYGDSGDDDSPTANCF